MIQFLILLAILFIVFVVLKELGVFGLDSDKKDNELLEKEEKTKKFTVKRFFFSQSERIFLTELTQQNNDTYFIFSKVRLEDVVEVRSDLSYKEKRIQRNYIKSKHVDFVLVDKQNSSIVALIELDGASHGQALQGKYDSIKNVAISDAGIRFYRVRVGEIFAVKIKEIFEEIRGGKTVQS